MRNSIKTLAVTSTIVAGLAVAPVLYAHDSQESGSSMKGHGMMGKSGMMGDLASAIITDPAEIPALIRKKC